MATDKLEKILEDPNWKEYLPLVGLYQMFKDTLDHRRIILDQEKAWVHDAYFVGLSLYNTAALYATVKVAQQAIEKFL